MILIARYPLNGNANDASGNGLHGTPNGGAYVPAIQGAKIVLDEYERLFEK